VDLYRFCIQQSLFLRHGATASIGGLPATDTAGLANPNSVCCLSLNTNKDFWTNYALNAFSILSSIFPSADFQQTFNWYLCEINIPLRNKLYTFNCKTEQKNRAKVEQNMKKISQKILTGTIAATFLIGGAGWLLNTQANAATTGTSAVQNSNTSTNDHAKRGHGSNLIQETATILEITDSTTITSQLKQGKTLAEVAQDQGVTEDVLLQKLSDAETQSINAAVTLGKITQTQADKQISGLAARLKKEVENTAQHNGHEKGGGFADKEALSQILGITPQELTTNLQAGQSLADIAQAKGISEDQLISQIKDSFTNKIKQFVEKKDQPEAGATPDAPSASNVPAPVPNTASSTS
jgi:hypothetical protein